MAMLKEISESYMPVEGNKQVLNRVINYIMNPSHVLEGEIRTGAVDLEHAAMQMNVLKRCFHKIEGRQLRHFVLSFGPRDHISIEEIFQINAILANLWGLGYQTVSAVHMNTPCPHIHTVINSVSYIDGRMYAGGYSLLNIFKNKILEVYPNLEMLLVIGK